MDKKHRIQETKTKKNWNEHVNPRLKAKNRVYTIYIHREREKKTPKNALWLQSKMRTSVKNDVTFGPLSQHIGHIGFLVTSHSVLVFFSFSYVSVFSILCVSWSKTKRRLSNYIFFILLFRFCLQLPSYILAVIRFVLFLWNLNYFSFGFFFLYLSLAVDLKLRNYCYTFDRMCIVIGTMVVMNDQKLRANTQHTLDNLLTVKFSHSISPEAHSIHSIAMNTEHACMRKWFTNAFYYSSLCGSTFFSV